jgi:hypothetical protein
LGRAVLKGRWVGAGGLDLFVLFFFFSLFFSIPFSHFFFKLLLKIFSKILDKLLTTQSIQNPCIQHDAQALGFSKLINYHCIYLKANLIIQIH